MANKEILLEAHNTTRHDGGVAIQLPDQSGTIYALASERVSRGKHDGDSFVAYDYMRLRLNRDGYTFGGSEDYFTGQYLKHQELHHHLGHAGSAFFTSDFNSAAVVVIDGQGPFSEAGKYASVSVWKGSGDKLDLVEINPEKEFSTQSLGLLYSAFTYHLGFGFLQEGKTMGLAAYGEKTDLYDYLKRWVYLDQSGRYEIDPNLIEGLFYLGEGKNFFHWENREPSQRALEIMPKLLHQFGEPRSNNDPITKGGQDLAWAVQTVLNELVLSTMQRAKTLTGCDNLCYAGGVALNSSTNGKLIESNIFKNIHILPSAGDDGQALGRMLIRRHQPGNKEWNKHRFVLENAYLGPDYCEYEVVDVLIRYKDKIAYKRLDEEGLVSITASLLTEGNVIGLWQGRSELGPRALGNRSIVADPRNPGMRDYINFEIKHREWFRPFAPSTILDAIDSFFVADSPLPYMLVVVKVKDGKASLIPAVIHVDGTARVQTVTSEQNRFYSELIKSFGNLTGIPILLNTSFNDAGEPLAETPEDAVKSFLKMKLDYLVMGNYLITRK